MSRFSWGPAFIEINRELLDKYKACCNSAEVIKVQTEHLDTMEKERTVKDENSRKSKTSAGYLDDMDLPPCESDEESD